MSNRHLSILLLILLTAGIVLAAGVLVVGPESVEDQTVELYQANQELLAEQGAGRIWETVRDVEVRLATSVSHQWAWLEQAQSRDDLEGALARLSHRSDRDFGITLAVLDEGGKVLAVQPDAPAERVEVLESHVHGLNMASPAATLSVCRRCLSGHRSLLVAADIDADRTLAASIDLERLAQRIFEQISRSRNAYAALLDDTGEVIYASSDQQERSQGRWVVGQAQIPGTHLRLEIAAPRSVIAPEVRARVQNLLYATYGVLALLLACIGVFVILKRREQREHLARVRSLSHQDKLATLGMMAASTAHEIRNAISVASLQLEVASSSKDDVETARHIEKAVESVGRLAELAENLSRYAGKGQHGTQRTSKRVDVAKVVDEALGVVQPRIQSRINVKVDCEDNLFVFGSRAGLVQVVVNLLFNACDALDDREGATVEIHTRRDGDDALICVVDNGAGIDPGALDRIFKPFFSTKDAETEMGGTGIGLWLCSQIIEHHNGSITAENIDSGGARFTIRIPTDRRARHEEAEAAE